MKKYFVSLALKVPANFNVEVNACSEEDALKIALENWEDRENSMDITEPDWEESKLDIRIFKNPKLDDLGNGIYIREVDIE